MCQESCLHGDRSGVASSWPESHFLVSLNLPAAPLMLKWQIVLPFTYFCLFVYNFTGELGRSRKSKGDYFWWKINSLRGDGWLSFIFSKSLGKLIWQSSCLTYRTHVSQIKFYRLAWSITTSYFLEASSCPPKTLVSCWDVSSVGMPHVCFFYPYAYVICHISIIRNNACTQ